MTDHMMSAHAHALRLRLRLESTSGTGLTRTASKAGKIRVTALLCRKSKSDTPHTNMHAFVTAFGLLFMMVSLTRNIRVAEPWTAVLLDYPKHHPKSEERARTRLLAFMDAIDTFKILFTLGYHALHDVCHFVLFCVIVVCRVVSADLLAMSHVMIKFSSVGLSSVGRGLPTLYDSTLISLFTVYRFCKLMLTYNLSEHVRQP